MLKISGTRHMGGTSSNQAKEPMPKKAKATPRGTTGGPKASSKGTKKDRY